jgi:flavorubredoxin
LRHISFSHFESDECGSLNEWLAQCNVTRGLRPAEVAAEISDKSFIL